MTVTRSALVMPVRLTTLLLTTALLAGCGSDAARTNPTNYAPVPPVTSAAGVSVVADTGSTVITESATVAPGGGPTVGDPCGLASLISGIDNALGGIMDPGVEVSDRKAAMGTFIASLESWTPTMPAEISADFIAIVDGFRGLAAALAAHDYDLPATMASEAGKTAFDALGNGDTGESFKRFNAWFLDTCGIDLEADNNSGNSDSGTSDSGTSGPVEAGTDPLANLRLPFDPCNMALTVSLTSIAALDGIDFANGFGGGTFDGDVSKQLSCGWYTGDQSLLSIAAVAFADGDTEAAARDIRTSIGLFGGKIENLDDRYPAPAFATVFDTLVTVYVLGNDPPFGVSFTRTKPGSDPEPDLDTTYAVVDALVKGLSAAPGGVDFPQDTTFPGSVGSVGSDESGGSAAEPIDAKPFDSENAVYGLDSCDAVKSAAVTNLVDTGGTTTSSGGGVGPAVPIVM